MVRASLDHEEKAERSAKRRKESDLTNNTTWQQYLDHFAALDLQRADAFEFTLPRPSHICTHTHHHSYFLSYYILIATTVQSSKFKRCLCAYDCVSAFLPDALWETIAQRTNSFIADQLSRGVIGSTSHHRLTSAEELKMVLLTRLYIISRSVARIEDLYKMVPLTPPSSTHS